MGNYREKNWILNTEHPLGTIRPGYNGNHQVHNTPAKNNFFQNFLPKSLAVSKRNRNFVEWYIATSIIVKR